jgi:signal transduction histidine kinase/ActR/RegA family two-component response regulator
MTDPAVAAFRSVDAPERSAGPLDVIQRLMAEPENVSLDLFLPELARAFAAEHVGLAGFVDGLPVVRQWLSAEGRPLPPVRWPWEEQPQLLMQVRQSPSAVAAQTADAASFLLACSGPNEHASWLLWLEGSGERSWSVGDRTALQVAVFALERHLPAIARSTRSRWHERARLQQRLEDAAHIVGRVAHDFGNVLTSILGFTELSLGMAPPNTPLHRYVAEVYQAAEQGAALTSRLKQFSQRNPAHGRPCGLGHAVGQEASRVRPLWGASATLQIDVPADLPNVLMDLVPLRQLLGHLLDNAQEALVGEGVVSLKAHRVELNEAECLELLGNPSAGSFVEVAIADNGTGFSPEARKRVFTEPFFSTKPRHRGLGLASVYGLLYTHRGGLRLEHGTGGGTVVRVYLPAALVPVTPAATPHSRTNGTTAGKHERILIVDDDALTLHLMVTALDQAGYRVQTAADGFAALDAFAHSAEPFQLVLTDVLMPRMTGFDLARRLLARAPGVKVLFTSGQIPAGFAQEDFAGRDFELLPKPFRPDGLLRAVRTALDRDPRGREPAPSGFPSDQGEFDR